MAESGNLEENPPSSGVVAETASTNPLSRKLNKILDTRLENDKVEYSDRCVSR